jgi:hypothetical protein
MLLMDLAELFKIKLIFFLDGSFGSKTLAFLKFYFELKWEKSNWSWYLARTKLCSWRFVSILLPFRLFPCGLELEQPILKIEEKSMGISLLFFILNLDWTVFFPLLCFSHIVARHQGRDSQNFISKIFVTSSLECR